MYLFKKNFFFFLYQFLMINSYISRMTVQCNKSLFIYTKNTYLKASFRIINFILELNSF